MIKRRNVSRNNKKRKIFLILFLIVIATIGIAAGMIYLPDVNDTAAKNKVIAILDRIQPGQEFLFTKQTIYGNKSIIPWNTGKFMASSREFVRTADVDVTTAEVKEIMSKTDFTLIDTPNPDSAVTQLVYKSKSNEYLKVDISNKVSSDASYRKSRMGVAQSVDDIAVDDPNAGPAAVKISVNPYSNSF